MKLGIVIDARDISNYEVLNVTKKASRNHEIESPLIVLVHRSDFSSYRPCN
jgi:hypothetical protein